MPTTALFGRLYFFCAYFAAAAHAPPPVSDVQHLTSPPVGEAAATSRGRRTQAVGPAGAKVPARGGDAGVDDLLARVRRTYAKRSYAAEFTQTYVDEVSGPRASETGQLAVSADGKVRFAYHGAEAKLFVFDGNDAWFAEPEAAQVTRFAGFADGPAGEALAFLWGGGAQLRDFSAEGCRSDCPPTKTAERAVTLRPRRPMAAVTRVDLCVAERSGEVVAVRVRDTLGNETRYALEARRFDRPAPAKDFCYAPPPGFSVVQALAQ